MPRRGQLPNTDPHSGEMITAAEVEAQAVALRKQGFSFRQIASRMGMSVDGVHSAVVRSLRKLNEQTRLETAELRALEGEKLDTLQAAIWKRAIEGDLPAFDRVLKLMERRAALYGLDAPKAVTLSSGDPTPAGAHVSSIAAQLDRMAADPSITITMPAGTLEQQPAANPSMLIERAPEAEYADDDER